MGRYDYLPNGDEIQRKVNETIAKQQEFYRKQYEDLAGRSPTKYLDSIDVDGEKVVAPIGCRIARSEIVNFVTGGRGMAIVCPKGMVDDEKQRPPVPRGEIPTTQPVPIKPPTPPPAPAPTPPPAPAPAPPPGDTIGDIFDRASNFFQDTEAAKYFPVSYGAAQSEKQESGSGLTPVLLVGIAGVAVLGFVAYKKGWIG